MNELRANIFFILLKQLALDELLGTYYRILLGTWSVPITEDSSKL